MSQTDVIGATKNHKAVQHGAERKSLAETCLAQPSQGCSTCCTSDCSVFRPVLLQQKQYDLVPAMVLGCAEDRESQLALYSP